MGQHLKHLLPCKHCSTPFLVRPYDYARGFRIYCGRDCSTAVRASRKEPSKPKRHYERKKRSMARNPEQAAARVLFESALKNGRIKRYPCVICNDSKTDGHHWDYSRPLDVYWLCRRHHVAVHTGRLFLPEPEEPLIPPKPWPRGQADRF